MFHSQNTFASHAPELTQEQGESLALSRKKSVAKSLTAGKQPRVIVEQWMNIMRSYYEPTKVVCKSQQQEQGGTKKLPTGTTFEGNWNSFGMQGQGVYNFNVRDQEVRYEGNFLNGEFHGEGDLIYDTGIILKCTWDHGEVVERRLYFVDGLERLDTEDWLYNKYPDRRYAMEYDTGVRPAGESFITPDEVPRPIPPGYYDVGYGFFQEGTSAIYSYDDLTRVLGFVSTKKREWIIANCRTNPLKSVGPCHFFYEKWQPPLEEAEIPPPPAAFTTAHRERTESMYDEDERLWQKFRFSRQSRVSRHASVAAKQTAF